eukprot:TRINITY_DN12207_c0_g1_i2.p1 TRINITY_DN12207_c0_g1~~TRINITY_DN12207_c0_g1_i2.p1  ORF type:complete len:375 (+),score=46.51 TRINITY_DN12207_c0_g1_i2:39-1127(+)
MHSKQRCQKVSCWTAVLFAFLCEAVMWRRALVNYGECSAELDRTQRLLDHVKRAAQSCVSKTLPSQNTAVSHLQSALDNLTAGVRAAEAVREAAVSCRSDLNACEKKVRQQSLQLTHRVLERADGAGKVVVSGEVPSGLEHTLDSLRAEVGRTKVFSDRDDVFSSLGAFTAHNGFQYVRMPFADRDTPVHLPVLTLRVGSAAASQGGVTPHVLFYTQQNESVLSHPRRHWLRNDGWVQLRVDNASMLPTVSGLRKWRPAEVWARPGGSTQEVLWGNGPQNGYLLFLRSRCCYQWGRAEGGNNGYRRCDSLSPGEPPYCNEVPFGRGPSGCGLGRWRVCTSGSGPGFVSEPAGDASSLRHEVT